jgi:hypothetical protein
MKTHFLGGLTLNICLLAGPALAVEAVSSSAGREAERAAVRSSNEVLAANRALLLQFETDYLGAANAPDAISALAKLYPTLRPRKDAPLSALSPVDLAVPSKDKALSAAEIAAIQRLQTAQVNFLSARAVVNTLESEQRSLESLRPIPGVQVNTGKTSSTFVPSITLKGDFEIKPTLLGMDGSFQVLVDVRPDPPSGIVTDVAQSIRTSTGVLTANLGLNLTSFRKVVNAGEGSQGIEFRVGLPFSYQRATSTGTGSQTPDSSTTDFGLFTPELKLSAWLRIILIGYKYNYYVSFGTPNAVSAELRHTSSHKAYMAARIDALSAKPNATSTVDSPFYFEVNYTGGKNSFGGGTFSIAFSKTLSWPGK